LLRQDDYLKALLVQFCWRQGKEYGTSSTPATMIMSVLANRVRAGWGTWQEVLDNVDRYAAAPLVYEGTPEMWKPDFTDLLHKVDLIHAGSLNTAMAFVNRTQQEPCMYWADTRRIETEFFKKKIQGNPEHRLMMNQNTLVFYS
jgi:hypothetical protein